MASSNRFTSLSFWFKSALMVSVVWLIYKFLQQGRVEIPQLINRLHNADRMWLLIGVLLSFVFIFLQGEMYIWALRSVSENVPRRLAILLYLKRNFVSVFLPVGSISSLAAFSQDVENQGIVKLKMSAASAIYLVAGIVTLWVIAIPILIFTAQSQRIDGVAYVSLLVLTVLLVGVFFLVINLKNKGKTYGLLTKYAPKIASQIHQLLATPMNRKALIMVNLASLGLEIVGILLLFVSIYAIGLDIAWLIPCLAYTIATLILYVAPVARGVGAIELSLIYILTQNGIDDNSALTVTLLYRFFGFWWPLVLGGLSFIPILRPKKVKA